MSLHPTQSDLERYQDEKLPTEEMVQIEKHLRDSPGDNQKLKVLNEQRDDQTTLGKIWRHGCLSCPDREELGSYLLGAMSDKHRSYVEFHLKKIRCQFCRANLVDLERQRDESAEDSVVRRQRIFQSSVGHLPK